MRPSITAVTCALSAVMTIACANDSKGSGAIGGSAGVGGGAGVGGSAGSAGMGGAGYGGVTGSDGMPLVDAAIDGYVMCADAEVHPVRTVPTVVFLVDGSSSMSTAYSDNLDRWHALREALLDPTDGIVRRLDGIVKFGLTIYNDSYDLPTCPNVSEVVVGTGNVAAIESTFPDTPPGFSTPTGAALDRLVRSLPDAAMASAQGLGPQLAILATDGRPYACVDDLTLDPPVVDEASVVAAATLGQSRGVSTYVISLAEATGSDADHLNAVAVAGGTQQAYAPIDRAALIARIEAIVSASVPCTVTLDGTIEDGVECMGHVTLNGNELPCNGDDGWRVTDPHHIELLGTACETFQTTADATLLATFPCGTYQPE